ncbi:uroporphyrinogen decarboxylase family protein [Treponema sp.]
MTSRERVLTSLNHKTPDQVAVDFGGTAVTGMHASCVEALRNHYGLSKQLVKIHEPFQCLGFIEDDLAEAIGVDIAGVIGERTMFGTRNGGWKEWEAPWGQTVLVGEDFETDTNDDGSMYVYPAGDRSVPPCAKLPSGGYFFDATNRQPPLPNDDDLVLEDNLEEFGYITDDALAFMKKTALSVREREKASIGNFGGTGLGDIALVPAMNLKAPKGIRDVTEWYVSTVARADFVHKIFEKETDIALQNLKRVSESFGDLIDVIFICGTDFGTQDSTFCSPASFEELYKPYYRKVNDWVHANTTWKCFKHCCGSIPSFMPLFIDAGFDIINPVQCSAKGMDPQWLKNEFGKDLVFWGGGVNTQATLPFGSPAEVRTEVLERLRIFSAKGGFVFNAIHNVQALTPTENIVAMLNAIKEFNGTK